MRTPADFLKDFVMEHNGRMPETEEEINEYLDALNHLNEYKKALEVESVLSPKMMKKLGFKTSEEVKKEYESKFIQP